MQRYRLAPAVGKPEAVRAISQYRRNAVIRWRRFWKQDQQKLTAIELIYLPYWCFSYVYSSRQMKDPVFGKVAVETQNRHTAILPEAAVLEPLPAGLPLLPVNGEPVPGTARDELYWEAFGREKKRIDIRIDITETAILYVPYWIGYLDGSKIDIVAVDGTSGKVDLGIKEAILKSMMA